jgi:hypothetical protein
LQKGQHIRRNTTLTQGLHSDVNSLPCTSLHTGVLIPSVQLHWIIGCRDLFQGILSTHLPSHEEGASASATRDFVDLYLSNILRLHRQGPDTDNYLPSMIQTITSYTKSHDIVPAQQERLVDICALRLIEILTDTVHPEQRVNLKRLISLLNHGCWKRKEDDQERK